MKRLWSFVRVLFFEGMLHRTADGEKLGFFSRRSWGSGMMFSGVIGCLIGAVWFAQRAHFELDALTTTSEVLDVSRDTRSNGEAVYTLKLKWADHYGNNHVTVPRARSSSYNVPIGTELYVDYDPNDPTDVRLVTQDGPWYAPSVISLGSLTSFLLGKILRGRPRSQRV